MLLQQSGNLKFAYVNDVNLLISESMAVAVFGVSWNSVVACRLSPKLAAHKSLVGGGEGGKSIGSMTRWKILRSSLFVTLTGKNDDA